MTFDPRSSTGLGEDACRHLLTGAVASPGVGRIAINGARSPYVIPERFTLVDGAVRDNVVRGTR
jgi:hypothetical protein